MNPAYISAFAALAGALIGGLTSFVTAAATQRTQLRHAHREAERAELKALYSEFIVEASRVFIDALTHQTGEITALVGLYAMVGRMQLVSDQAVIVEAWRVEEIIIETYQGPVRTLPELMDLGHQGGLGLIRGFSEACRKDLAARATAIR